MKKIFLFLKRNKEKILFALPCSTIFFSFLPLHNNDNSIFVNSSENKSNNSRSVNQPTSINSEYTLNGLDTYFNNVTGLSKQYNEVYASQHFGNWLGISITNTNNTYESNAETISCLKQLVLLAINNLVMSDELGVQIDYLNSDNYLKINNYYVDNFSGQIVIEARLNIYYDSSGQIIDTNKNSSYEPLSQIITFDGFKEASETIISSSIQISSIGGITVTSANINDFTSTSTDNVNKILAEFNNSIVNSIVLEGDWINSKIDQQLFTTKSYSAFNGLNNYEKIVAYPGLKQLRTNIGVENYFTKKYVDVETFKIYDRPANGNENFRQEIGTFSFGKNMQANHNNLRTISFNYENDESNKTTYIKEGKFQILPNFFKGKVSDFNINEPDSIKQKKNYENLLNNLFTPINSIIVNPFNEQDNSLTKIEVVTSRNDALNKGYINDLTGELTLDVKVSGTYYLNGKKITTNANDFRIFTIVIYGFDIIQSTTIYSSIDISGTINQKASEFVVQGSTSANTLKQALIDATNNNHGFISPTAPINEYINNYVVFKTYLRQKNNVEYLGVPNDVNGTLELTLEISSYYNDENGLIVVADKPENNLILTTTLYGFQKVDVQNSAYIVQSNEGIILTEYNGIQFNTIIAKDAFKYLTIDMIKNIIYDFGIGGEKTENLKNKINFTSNDIDSNKTESLYDAKTSNLDGALNLHFSISGGILDKTDGIEISSNYTILFIGFKQTKETFLNDEVDLLFTNTPPFALDILFSNDSKQKLKTILLSRPENIINIFKDEMGIPLDLRNTLIDNVGNNNFETLLQLFDNYFEINEIDRSIDQQYSKEGYIQVSISLKTYYDTSGDLIKANSPNLYKNKNIIFTGFKVAKETIVTQEVNLREQVGSMLVTDVYNPYDTNRNTNKIKELVVNNKNLFFKNIPNVFFENENNLIITNPNVNSKLGTISFDVQLVNYYFDNKNNYVESKITTFNSTITGFSVTTPTVIIPVVKNTNLINENGSETSNNLIDWVKKDNNNNPQNKLDIDNLTSIIRKNIEKFVDNSYPIRQDTIMSDYLNVKYPVVDFSNASISFDLELYSYYDENGIVVSKQNIDNNKKNPLIQQVKIIGFNRNVKTEATSNPLNVKSLDSSLADISVENLIKQNGTALMDVLRKNTELLSLIFKNLPSTYNDANYFTRNARIKYINETEKGACEITFTLNYVYIQDPDSETIKFGTTDLKKSFDGFLEISKTDISEKNWDLNPNLLSGFNIAYWNETNIVNELLPLLNESEIIEKYVSNVVYDDVNGKILTKIIWPSTNKYIRINPKNGEISIKVALSPYYDNQGNKMTNNSRLYQINIRNFVKQNPTEINQSIIYTNQLINSDEKPTTSDPIFGNKIMSQWFYDTGSTNGASRVGEEANKKLLSILTNNGGEKLINLMLYNTVADKNIIPNDNVTRIKNVKILEYNDFEGSIKFMMDIENYFDEDGRWISAKNGDTNLNQAIFTIYQNNKTYATNLTKNEASVIELQKFYDAELYENSIPLNPSLKASEFYKTITIDRNFSKFESFIESLSTKEVYGVPAINTPTKFMNLEINVWNDNELSNGSSYKDFISYNDEEGSVTLQIRYNNVYDKIISPDDVGYSEIKQWYLSNSSTYSDKFIKIVGFLKDTSQSDLTIIISAVGGSVGLIIIIALLAIFLYKKAKQV